jgi:hypothetical protein
MSHKEVATFFSPILPVQHISDRAIALADGLLIDAIGR